MSKRVTEGAPISGSPEDVWPLVTDPNHFRTWYAFGGAEIDLRPGGSMTLRWEEHGAFEAIVESVIPRKFFSFRWRPEQGGSNQPQTEFENNDEIQGIARLKIPDGKLEELKRFLGRCGFHGMMRLG